LSIVKPRSWLLYTVLRLLTFFVPLTVLLLAGVEGWIAAVVSAVFGLAFSFIFLRGPRDTVSTALYEARHPAGPVEHPDEDSEDAVLDNLDNRDLADAESSASGSESVRDREADADHQ
jgi:hypothetical protein